MDRREEELLIRAAMAARLPWLSPDAEPELVYKTDSQELIDKCCHCMHSECVDCIAGRTHEHVGQPTKTDRNTFADLLLKGFGREQICSVLGIGDRTYYRYKKLMKGAIA